MLSPSAPLGSVSRLVSTASTVPDPQVMSKELVIESVTALSATGGNESH